MRNVLPLLGLLAVSACGTPSHWEKPGTDTEATRAAFDDCRIAARKEASSDYGFGMGLGSYGPVWWGYPGRPGALLWRQRLDSDRFHTENRLAAFCMKVKGYELVPDQPAASPPARDK